jgi:hypothetical protein
MDACDVGVLWGYGGCAGVWGLRLAGQSCCLLLGTRRPTDTYPGRYLLLAPTPSLPRSLRSRGRAWASRPRSGRAWAPWPRSGRAWAGVGAVTGPKMGTPPGELPGAVGLRLDVGEISLGWEKWGGRIRVYDWRESRDGARVELRPPGSALVADALGAEAGTVDGGRDAAGVGELAVPAAIEKHVGLAVAVGVHGAGRAADV